MTKILIEYESLSPTVHGIYDIMNVLGTSKQVEVKFMIAKKIRRRDIAWGDILISIRGFSPLSLQLAKSAKKAGRFYAIFLDDDLLNLPEDYPVMNKRQNSLIEIMKYVDSIICVNPLIGEKYKKLCPKCNYVRCDTVINGTQIIDRNESQNDKVKIVYAANKRHILFWEKYISPIVPKICDEFRDRISFTFVGVKPDVSKLQGICEINFADTMPYNEYSDYMAKGKFDIGIAPLSSGDFFECKYFNKFIEYSKMGIFGIYSNTMPYTMVVRDGVNGFLCENTEDGWLTAFRRAIEDKTLRNRCIAEAQRLLRSDFSGEQIISKLKRDLPEIMSFKAPKIKPFHVNFYFHRIRYLIFMLHEHFYFICLHLKKEGLVGTYRRAIAHVKLAKKINKG